MHAEQFLMDGCNFYRLGVFLSQTTFIRMLTLQNVGGGGGCGGMRLSGEITLDGKPLTEQEFRQHCYGTS